MPLEAAVEAPLFDGLLLEGTGVYQSVAMMVCLAWLEAFVVSLVGWILRSPSYHVLDQLNLRQGHFSPPALAELARVDEVAG